MARKDVYPNGPINVLLVDDEVGFVDVVAKRMSKRKLNVTKAYSGAQAFQIMRKNDFDVVILDLKMEDMDGIEVLKILKKMDPDLKVIMLTGHGSERAARDGLELGAADYLTKPCDLDELVSKIREVHKHGR
jgi:DNA-binding response OmpR family regulator